MGDRIAFVQSPRWHHGLEDGGDPYDDSACAYCGRPVRPDAARLRTGRTNNGEWWLLAADLDLAGDDWRDFQTQLDGSRAPTLLPIGPDCLRSHPEFSFALVASPEHT